MQANAAPQGSEEKALGRSDLRLGTICAASLRSPELQNVATLQSSLGLPVAQPESRSLPSAGAAVVSSDKAKLVYIDGVAYDVAGFVHRHPGGDGIWQALDTDASVVFHTTHSQAIAKRVAAGTVDGIRCLGPGVAPHAPGPRLDVETYNTLRARLLAAVGGRKSHAWDRPVLYGLAAAFPLTWAAALSPAPVPVALTMFAVAVAAVAWWCRSEPAARLLIPSLAAAYVAWTQLHELLLPLAVQRVLLSALHGFLSVENGFHVLHPYVHGALHHVRVLPAPGANSHKLIRRMYAASPTLPSLLANLTGGVNTLSYRRDHAVIHHADTSGSRDIDVNNTPLLRQREDQLLLPHYAWQHAYAWVLYAFAAMAVEVRGAIDALILRSVPASPVQRAGVALAKAVHIFFVWVLPFYLYGPVHGALLVAPRVIVASVIFLFVITWNHQQDDAAVADALAAASAEQRDDSRVRKDPRAVAAAAAAAARAKELGITPDAAASDWLAAQVVCTTTTAPDSFLALALTGGISVHLVHHIAPELSIWHLPAAHVELRRWAAERGWRLREKGVLESWRSHVRFLRAMGSSEFAPSESGSGAASASNEVSTASDPRPSEQSKRAAAGGRLRRSATKAVA